MRARVPHILPGFALALGVVLLAYSAWGIVTARSLIMSCGDSAARTALHIYLVLAVLSLGGSVAAAVALLRMRVRIGGRGDVR